MCWILVPLVYYTDTWNSKALPIGTSQLYRSDGSIYDVNAVLDSNSRLNITAYKQYGTVRLSAMFVLSYGPTFAILPACIIHAVLFHGKEILNQFNMSITEATNEIHGKLMAKYKEVPEWWYTIVFCLSFVMAALSCQLGGFMPWYWLFLTTGIVFILLLPLGSVQAVSNQQITLGVICELVAGYLMAGNPIGVMTFKTYGYITLFQTLLFLQDLKLGHYMKIPPRLMFAAQLLGTVISCVISYAVTDYIFLHVKDICTEKNANWSCTVVNLFYSTSVIWGAVG
ncbi:unnamed protein product, partial [Didymodactylos carnosus]